MSKVMSDALNKQLNREFFASYLYLSMSAWFEKEGMAGFASWMKVQFGEEQQHVERFFNYMAERGYDIALEALDAPPSSWKSPLDAFEAALDHEKKVTAWINELVDLAISEKDHATNNFLQWYVAEQVEEEASVSNIIGQLKMIDGNGQGLFLLDKELGARTLAPMAAN